MAGTRISKIMNNWGVGLGDVVNELKKMGVEVDMSPNAKIPDENLDALRKRFQKDIELKSASDKVDVRLTDILGKTSKDNPQKKKDEEEEESSTEIRIKTGLLSATRKETPVVKEVPTTPKTEPSKQEQVKPEPVKPEPASQEQAKPEPVKTEPVRQEQPKLELVKPEPVRVEAVKSETVKVEEEKPRSVESVVAPAPAKDTPIVEVKPAPEVKPKEEVTPEVKPVVAPEPAQEVKQEKTTPNKMPQQNNKPKTADFNKKPFSPRPDAQKPATLAHDKDKPIVTSAPEAKKESADASASSPFKVVGKIDLAQFDRKPAKKRDRISKGPQKVDVSKAGSGPDASKKNVAGGNRPNGGQRQQGGQRPNGSGGQNAAGRNRQGQGGAGKGRDQRGGSKFQPVLTEAQQEEMQKEIQKQVKETYAKMNEGKKNNFGAKYRKEKRDAAAQRTQEEMAEAAVDKKTLQVTEFVTVNDLATLMNNTPVVKVIGACMSLGLMVSINQRLDAETLVLVAEEFGYKVEFVTAEISEEINSAEQVDRPEDLVPRPPIITVMGHVDHGKTSLLDYIRKSNVIAGEAGGITQHIGAYNVTLPDGRHITFLDTPGHEAFTAMRARGAQLTDIAIIIVAADDAVMPQTIEAINHAQAANVPMVFAINKIDKPGANPDTIRRQLSEMNILVEDWGGKYQCQEISAKKGLNVDKLLEKVLLETDLLELKANPNKPAVGAVIESSLDKGRGYLATVLVQEGTLHQGDVMLCGSYYGRVKSMFNERGQKVMEAGPSTPVSVLGLGGAPAAGEKFNVMLDEKEAKNIANRREQLMRIQGIKTQKHMTLEEIGRRIAIGNFKELNIIVKGDVDGSVEALSDSLIKLSTEEVRVNIIHKAVGGISESDVLLAEASDAIIVGFQVRPTVDARKVADREGIEIRLYSVIYDCINEVKDGIEGMLEPEKKEEIIATALVKQVFHISKVGTIAGCLMRDGKMLQKSKVRLIRDGIVIYTGELGSLQIGKDAVKEVVAGKECGMSIAGYNDIKEKDLIEAFQIVEIKRTL